MNQKKKNNLFWGRTGFDKDSELTGAGSLSNTTDYNQCYKTIKANDDVEFESYALAA